MYVSPLPCSSMYDLKKQTILDSSLWHCLGIGRLVSWQTRLSFRGVGAGALRRKSSSLCALKLGLLLLIIWDGPLTPPPTISPLSRLFSPVVVVAVVAPVAASAALAVAATVAAVVAVAGTVVVIDGG